MVDARKILEDIKDSDEFDFDLAERLINIGISKLMKYIVYNGRGDGDNQIKIMIGVVKSMAELYSEVDRISRLSSMPYSDYLKTPEWKYTRNLALMKSGYQCSICSEQSGLEVHHLTYERRGNEALLDLQVLCEKHHKEVHGK